MSASVELAGFADPVSEAQATFRAVLDAMARPGTLHRIGEGLVAPSPLDPATAAVMLALVDNETPLWLDAAAAAARDWLAFHCGAAIVESSDQAMFGVALSPVDLARFPAGSDEMPENSATLILQVASLEGGRQYRLSGPGLREPALVSIGGLAADFTTIWRRNHALYPRGVDVILCAGTTIAALPRSVAIEEA